ncbi:hypothetical protein C8R30_101148 [Nitrosomonas nitrosa]|uniref:hypothetical protein n=1 Tax=Nitrosomonas nitrosa TaxID=52442 RepID=UPI000D30173B|nr:hypothetical protein [Nitrosomonas nitrosa]PTR04951.1 hypothetical protein C8R30_101148 [Nitrosomonas nitrosa]
MAQIEKMIDEHIDRFNQEKLKSTLNPSRFTNNPLFDLCPESVTPNDTPSIVTGYDPSPMGCGKTTLTLQKIQHLHYAPILEDEPFDPKVLLVAPTLELAIEIEKKAKKLKIPTAVIFSDHQYNGVPVKNVRTTLTELINKGTLPTLTVVSTIHYFMMDEGRKSFFTHTFIDDLSDIDDSVTFNLTSNFPILKKYIEVVESEEYPLDYKAIFKHCSNLRHDDYIEENLNVMHQVYNSFDWVVDREKWDELECQDLDDKKKYKLTFHRQPRKTIFAPNTTILRSEFDKSNAYIRMRRLGFHLRKIRVTAESINPPKNDIPFTIYIVPFSKGNAPISNNWLVAPNETTGKPPIEYLKKWISENMEGAIVTIQSSNEKYLPDNVDKISIKNAGLNSYSDRTKIACAHAYRHDFEHEYFYRKNGISPLTAIGFQRLDADLQTLGRSALRNLQPNMELYLFVLDTYAAEAVRAYVVNNYPKGNVVILHDLTDFTRNLPEAETVDNFEQRYRDGTLPHFCHQNLQKYWDKSEAFSFKMLRDIKAQAKDKQEHKKYIKEKDKERDDIRNPILIEELKQARRDKKLEEIRELKTDYTFQGYATKFDTEGIDIPYIPHHGLFETFKALTVQVENKDHAPSFCAFSTSGTGRKKEDMISSTFIVLDIDNTEENKANGVFIPIDPYLDYFNKNKHVGAIYTTHSGGLRVILSLKNGQQMDADLYRQVAKKYAEMVQAEFPEYKVDLASLNPSQIYYAPSYKMENVKKFKLKRIGRTDRDGGIDIDQFIADDYVPEIEVKKYNPTPVRNNNIGMIVDELMSGKYSDLFTKDDTGHSNFWKTVRVLFLNGYTPERIHSMHWSFAGFERKLQKIKEICNQNHFVSVGWLVNIMKNKNPNLFKPKNNGG